MKIRTYDKNQNVPLRKNFNLKGFHCKCSYSECQTTLIDDRLLDVLQIIREFFKAPIFITSAYRCETHNHDVGGVKESQHVRGKAADIFVLGIDACDVQEVLIQQQFILGIVIGRYDKFTHIDVRGKTFIFDKRSNK